VTFKKQFEEYAQSCGVSASRLSDAHSVAVFEEEIRVLAAEGGHASKLIPSGTRRTLTEIGIFVRKGMDGVSLDMDRLDYLLATPGLPEYVSE